jgi:diamine N-acetyltransferase
MLQKYVDKVDDSDLPQPLKNTLAAFVDDFQEIIETPNFIHRFYMNRLLALLVNEVSSKEPPENLWWEVCLSISSIWANNCGDAGEIILEHIEALKPLLEAHLPDDASEVTLNEISMETVFGIIMLSEALTEPKKSYVAANAVSLSQAHFSDKAWFRAIYAGRKPIGFAMLSLDEEQPMYYLWRFMIAEPYHGRGYGRKAMEAIKDHVRTLPNATELYLSYGQGEGSPEGFYKKIGFEDTGVMHGNEVEAKIKL